MHVTSSNLPIVVNGKRYEQGLSVACRVGSIVEISPSIGCTYTLMINQSDQVRSYAWLRCSSLDMTVAVHVIGKLVLD